MATILDEAGNVLLDQAGNPIYDQAPVLDADILQTVTGAITAPAGIGTTTMPVATQEGSWLAVFAGWNCVTEAEYAPLPAVNVTDSAGNLWQQAAITAPGTTSTRTAVWVAANALPAQWVSVGLTGGAAAASWVIAEIAGMPQAASLDFAVGATGQGTAVSVPWTASGDDAGFAVVTSGYAFQTGGSAPSGWQALPSSAPSLTQNSYFADGTDGWVSYAGDLAVVSGTALPSGSPFPQAAYTSTASSGTYGIKTASMLAASAGGTYQTSAWVRTGGTVVGVYFAWQGASTTFTGQSVTSGTWTQVTASATAPAGVTGLWPEITSSGGALYAEAFQVLQTGPGTAGAMVFPFWNTGMTAGGGTTSLALGTASSWSYALCGLVAGASPPPQPVSSFPAVMVEAAFGATPGNPSSSTDYLFSSEYVSWTDITARVIGPAVQGRIKLARGRQYQLQQQEAGNATIPLSNVDGAFTPTNPGSPYYSNALNENMSFQSGVAPWTGDSGVGVTQSSAYTFASGVGAVAQYSAQVTPNGSGDSTISSEYVPVNPNFPYSASAWVLSPGGWASGAYVNIWWYTASKSFISSSAGDAAALPAGTWVQVTKAGVTPPADAAYARLLVTQNGSPAAADIYYAAEAALVAGTIPVSTGLVTPLTPIRVTAWWQGRQYPVWQGYAQQWPQEWPDLPQWGFSTLKAGDALAVAGAGSMYSALIGEVLTDAPYAYLPCNESYTSAITGATPANPFIFTGGYLQPADANGLPAVNYATGNEITGTYLDGFEQEINTGLTMNFLGDSGTGMGADNYQSDTPRWRGPSLLYQDPDLADAIGTDAGFTVEFWFNWDPSGTPGDYPVTLLTLFGPPSAYMVGNSGTTLNGSVLQVYIEPDTADLVVSSPGVTIGDTAVVPSQAPQYCAVTVAAGASPQVTLWLNGVAVAAGSLDVDSTLGAAVQAAVLGPGSWVCDANAGTPSYWTYNYAAGHLAFYPYQLPGERITAHYQAGAAGWQGTDAATRFAQILRWAQLGGVKPGGWNKATAAGQAEITQIGPAYNLSGQSAAAGVYNTAQSEGGRYGVRANGSLVYLERDSQYNLPVSAVLSDANVPAPVVLNPNPGFAGGAAGWTVSGGSIAYTPGNAYGSYGAVTLTPGSGETVTGTSPGFSWNGGPAQAGFWVNLPSGGTVTVSAGAAGGGGSVSYPGNYAVPGVMVPGYALLGEPVPSQGMSYTGASSYTSYVVPPGAWTFIPVTVAAAGTATAGAVLSVASESETQLAWAAMWEATGSVPYQAKSSYGFDMTYLYNEVTSTQQDGPNELVVYDSRGTASVARFFRRSALTFQQNVVSAYDVSDITTWSLAQYQEPYLHVSGVTVNAAGNPLQAFPVILALDEGMVAEVSRHPLGGAPLTETGTVERVSHEIGPGFWQATYQLSPYGPSQNVLAADTPGFDAAGTSPTLIMAW